MIWQGDSNDESPNYSARANFYGVGGIPHAQFGGIHDVVGGGTNMLPYYQSKYNMLIDLDSPLTIDLTFYVNAQSEYIIQADAEVTGDITTSNNKILLILTRYISDSYFSSVATYEEMPFNLLHIGQTGIYETAVDLQPNWNIDDLKAVAIVQTWDNDPAPNEHTIHQAAIAGFSYLNPVSPSLIDFGDVAIGSSQTEQLVITNYWESELTGSIFSIPNFEIVYNFVVPAFESIDLDVTFTPTEETDYQGDIIITTNNENFPTVFVTVMGSGYEDSGVEGEYQAKSSQLIDNYPNPFHSNTTISYYLAAEDEENAKISIYNMKGQRVKTLACVNSFNAKTTESLYQIEWNGKDETGRPVNSGIYFYKLKSGSFNSVKKMILLR